MSSFFQFKTQGGSIYENSQKLGTKFSDLIQRSRMSAQIKMVIDRFHGIDNLLRGTNKKTMLLVSAASTEKRIMNGVVGSYHETTHYLGWQDTGILLAYGCYSRSDMEKTDYPEQAYQLGRSVK